MRTLRQTGHSDRSNLVTCVDAIAHPYRKALEVTVSGLPAATMVDGDRIAVVSQKRSRGYTPLHGCLNCGADRRGNIDAGMQPRYLEKRVKFDAVTFCDRKLQWPNERRLIHNCRHVAGKNHTRQQPKDNTQTQRHTLHSSDLPEVASESAPSCTCASQFVAQKCPSTHTHRVEAAFEVGADVGGVLQSDV